MHLTKITIANFRSILRQEIEVTHRCIGLIGLNEAGKSNVLFALRLFEESFQPSVHDACKITNADPEVTLWFELDPDEASELEKIGKEWADELIYSTGPKNSSVKNIREVRHTLRVVRDAEEKLSKEITTSLSLDLDVPEANSFASYEDKSPVGEVVIKTDGEEFKLSDVWGVERILIDENLHEHLKPLNIDGLNDSVNSAIVDALIPEIPKVVFWQYDSKYLLSAEMTYDDFIKGETPYENSAPLFNAMQLCPDLNIKTVEDLKKKIAIWRKDSSQRLKDAAILTDGVNAHIHRIWADYNQQISIHFEEVKMTIHIKDPESSQRNYYSMEARSQGFKTFVSFILTAAAEAITGTSGSTLLLLDEPETHLHPSGARFMKQELLKLSESHHYIIYATNSIFMIDRSDVERHVIVKKKNEITSLTRVKANNLIQEAVVYEAMGTRVDEFSIGLHNIVLEGNLDLILLSFFVNKILDEQVAFKLKKFRLWNGGGTNNIDKFLTAKMLPLDSVWHVILDRDMPAVKLKEKIDKKVDKFLLDPSIRMVAHLYPGQPDFEVEDILPKEMLVEAFVAAIQAIGVSAEPPAFEDGIPYSVVTNKFKLEHIGDNKQLDSLFEISFKDKLETLVVTKLNDIANKQNVDEKREDFKSAFPKYQEFVLEFVKNVAKKNK